MNRPLVAFLVKLVATVGALYFIALFWPLIGYMTFIHALILGVVIAVLGYITDLIVPRAVNNIVATFLDFVMVAGIVYLANYVLPGYYASDSFAIICGLLVAFVEIFFHLQFVRKTSVKPGPNRR